MEAFTFQLKTTVCFGANVVSGIVDWCRNYNAKRILVVTDQGVRKAGILEKVEKILSDAGIENVVFDDVEPDPGLETIHRCASCFRENKCDLILAVGGGSPIDTAKGARVIVENGGHIRDYAGVNKVPRAPVTPLIAIPTTSGTGSEVTTFAVLSDWENRMKITISSPFLAPEVAVVDPLLTMTAPPSVTAASGIDALSHAIETYVSLKAQPPAEALALKAIELIGESLRTAVADGSDKEARTRMSLGSLLAGMAFNNSLLGLTHSIGAALSGHAHVSHGMAIGLLLPYVMEFNAMARMEKFSKIAIALGENVKGLSLREAALRSVKAVRELVKDISLPRRLGDVGVTGDMIEGMAKDAMGHGMLKFNPRAVTEKDIMAILRKAL
ncbi:iron-containing alcohol dehydrogenase [Desulfofundulus thermosubterraneus]|uniref:Alcohol dehydrogenase n=1 Tax=Desulfofundulus thermosubterraneus DSM 16057 TaxID=1121432 RepID=A0A1M6F877_9FIRM|nr:iron-containing alcohol dehydrogenase [Desulfofundulus thermosubterraneus]SHI93895.1 alcohol dehydrogenase [Desulfofundulus thermosubterraneus DSM 16057]